MDPARYVVFGTVALGAAFALWRAYLSFGSHNLNVEMLAVQLCKLISANNIERAIKLCNAAPNPYAVKVLRPMLDAALQGAGETELRQVLIAETERQQTAQRIGTISGIVALATLAVAAAFDWTFPGKPRGTATIAAGVGAAVALLALSKAAKHRAQTIVAAESMIAAINKQRARS